MGHISLEAQGASIGLHLYQPIRLPFHHRMQGIKTDPLGEDWNLIAIKDCYRQLALGGALRTMPFDSYATLRGELAIRDHDTFSAMTEAMQHNGIGDSFSHNILPDMSDADKRILIEAGRNQYITDVGVPPSVFWGAEGAYDNPTIETLVDFGYSAFVCAPEQIYQMDSDTSDSRPTRITLPSGRSIIALPFDRGVSSVMAWDHDARINADDFVEHHIRPALERIDDRNRRHSIHTPNVLITFTDGETFGLHDKNGHLFAIYLGSKALQNNGIQPVSLNDLIDTLEATNTQLPSGRLKERTAWSCAHGLDRWSKGCGCTPGDSSWKSSFYEANRQLNETITNILQWELPGFENILARTFDISLRNPGGKTSTREASLLSAKASALAGRTSCGTFFEDFETSGYINVMFGIQAICHLLDAGLPEEKAYIILHRFLTNLEPVIHNGKSARTIAEGMVKMAFGVSSVVAR